ncbi:MAG: zinc ribbon domain-containing protein [Chloroflexi bacterium]|nr:zinc ribbon domain-containing protein [Chloroflexota bacterium]
MPYCANCGQQLTADARFCAACGRPVAQPQPVHAAPAQAPASQQPPEPVTAQATPVETPQPAQPPQPVSPQQAAPPVSPPGLAPTPVAPPPHASGLPQRARTMGMLCHLSAFAGFVFPFGNILGPLLMWLISREEHPFIDHNGKESVNFQISVIIFALICIPLLFIIVGFFLLFALAVYAVIAVIVASIRAANGEFFRYPITFRFLK